MATGVTAAVRASFTDVALALFLLAGADALLFHAGLYFPWLKPDSHSGEVEATARRVRHALAHTPLPNVLLVGDSTTLDAVCETVLDQQLQAAGLPLYSLNAALKGATANAWLPVLRSLPLERTAALVIGVFTVALESVPDHRPDQEIAKTRMTIADGVALAFCYDRLELRLQTLFTALYRTPLYREDVLDFARHPRARLREVAVQRREEAARDGWWRHDNVDRRDLTSVRIVGDTASFDRAVPWLAKARPMQRFIQLRLTRRARERRDHPVIEGDPGYLWSLARAIRMANRRGIPVVVAVMPATPYPSPCHEVEALDALCRAESARGGSVALYHDEPLIGALERPEYFRDAWHLNAAGAQLYTCGLAQFLAHDPRLRREGTPEAEAARGLSR